MNLRSGEAGRAGHATHGRTNRPVGKGNLGRMIQAVFNTCGGSPPGMAKNCFPVNGDLASANSSGTNLTLGDAFRAPRSKRRTLLQKMHKDLSILPAPLLLALPQFHTTCDSSCKLDWVLGFHWGLEMEKSLKAFTTPKSEPMHISSSFFASEAFCWGVRVALKDYRGDGKSKTEG